MQGFRNALFVVLQRGLQREYHCLTALRRQALRRHMAVPWVR